MRKKILAGGFLMLLAVLLLKDSAMLATATSAVDKTYGQLRMMVEVMGIIRENYVDVKENEDLITSAIKGMVRDLDGFSQFLEPDEYKAMRTETEGQFGGLGIRIAIRDDMLTVVTPLPGTPAFRIGILPGDKIINIEQDTTRGMSVNDAVKRLRGNPGTKVNITIARDGEKEPLEYTITREIIKIESVRARILPDGVGYIRINEFSSRTGKDVKKALDDLKEKEMKYLVLDLRNNPGGLLDAAVEVSAEFLPAGKLIVYTKGRKQRMNMEFKSPKGASQLKIPMAVLVNRGSASGSEILAGALQDHKRAIIVGSESFGKGSVQSVFPLADGNAVRLTTAKYYTPSGRLIHRDEKTQKGGITPDVIIEVSRETEVKLQQQLEEIHTPGKEPESSVSAKDRVEDEVFKRAVDLLKLSSVLKTIVTE